MKNFFVKFFATGFFVGYIPTAPGTFATLLAAAGWWFLPEIFFFIIAFLFFLISFFVCGRAEKIFGIKDDQHIVIDEIIGYYFAVAFLPKTFSVLISSIILFRFFDIKKPFFIKSVQKYKDCFGILADDIISGIFTNLILQIILIWK